MTILWPDGGAVAPAKPGTTDRGFRSVSEYGYRWHPVYHDWRLHQGIDLIGIPDGLNRAPVDGVVTIATYSGGYGNLVEVTGPDGTRYRYGHNSKFLVKKGDKVKAGQALAVWGMTGTATGIHTHFEVLPKGKSQVNPRTFMNAANAGSTGGGGTPIPERKKKMTAAVFYTKDGNDKSRRGAVIDTQSGFVSVFGYFSKTYADAVAVGFGLTKAAPVTDGHFDALVRDARALGSK